MFGICAAIFALVLALMALALILRRRRERERPPLGDTGFVVLGGIALPVVVLVVLLVKTLLFDDSIRPSPSALTLRVTGHMWWWDVRYPDGVRLANELYVPVGEPVRIELRADRVIHSFWVPSLGGKTDAIPGLTNVHWLKADAPGIYRGACAEFCGLQHARMGFYVVALPPEEFRRWREARRTPPPGPGTAEGKRGLAVFLERGCAQCHGIAGTPAAGDVGPDLTHMGSRLSIGAATVPNNFGNLAGWIADPQHMKPGNEMPATYLGPEELLALTSYLMGLK